LKKKKKSNRIAGKNYLVIDPYGHCELPPPLDVPLFPDWFTSLPEYLASVMFAGYNKDSNEKPPRQEFEYDLINFYVMAPVDDNNNGGEHPSLLSSTPISIFLSVASSAIRN
jgi:hypothetical protein